MALLDNSGQLPELRRLDVRLLLELGPVALSRRLARCDHVVHSVHCICIVSHTGAVQHNLVAVMLWLHLTDFSKQMCIPTMCRISVNLCKSVWCSHAITLQRSPKGMLGTFSLLFSRQLDCLLAFSQVGILKENRVKEKLRLMKH